jgi:hypothetical protein
LLDTRKNYNSSDYDECPFHKQEYVSSLYNLGCPERSISAGFSLLRRPIPGTKLFDGIGSWPYLYIDNPKLENALRYDFSHLISITAVTQPGYKPIREDLNPILLKEHYVFDPNLSRPILSKRARKRLQKVEEVATFEVISNDLEKLLFFDHYRDLIIRRNLTGAHIDFPIDHFKSIINLPEGIFFRVRNNDNTGALACGVIFHGMLQILHMVFPIVGLKWNASYLMMKSLQDFACANGLRMLTGGMPDFASEGLRIFKSRWANVMEPVYLLRLINNQEAYEALSAQNCYNSSYFPAYRNRHS